MSFQILVEPIHLATRRRVDVRIRVFMCVYVLCIKAQKNSRYAGATNAKCKSARMHFSAIKRHTDSFSPGLANAAPPLT